ncbi:hypothetical protein [Arthrobacter sp. 4R501]|uniref:hypothetical protein n=1 Tax=Arthrobacter sp. 4R501 TaxID=2058886 RepID=UPI000CE3B82B|nr:hypothetical protein [Arthrobacter sp. 4R501]
MTTAFLERPLAAVAAVEAAASLSIDLQFSTAHEMHEGLDNAVATLIEPAKEAVCGILVTRLRPGRFIVALDESVPFGETYESIAA